MTGLPQPVTTADTYLAAIVDELKQLNAQLVKQNAANTAVVEPGTVELKETTKKRKPRTRRKAAPKKAAPKKAS